MLISLQAARQALETGSRRALSGATPGVTSAAVGPRLQLAPAATCAAEALCRVNAGSLHRQQHLPLRPGLVVDPSSQLAQAV